MSHTPTYDPNDRYDHEPMGHPNVVHETLLYFLLVGVGVLRFVQVLGTWIKSSFVVRSRPFVVSTMGFVSCFACYRSSFCGVNSFVSRNATACVTKQQMSELSGVSTKTASAKRANRDHTTVKTCWAVKTNCVRVF